jgi:hypothetical protein
MPIETSDLASPMKCSSSDLAVVPVPGDDDSPQHPEGPPRSSSDDVVRPGIEFGVKAYRGDVRHFADVTG